MAIRNLLMLNWNVRKVRKNRLEDGRNLTLKFITILGVYWENLIES